MVPGLEPGFRRAAIEYQVDKDGLTCDYQVSDQQVHTVASWPATHISGTHTESTNDGVNYLAECNIRLEGPVNADKRDMMTQAYRIVDAKLLISSRKMNQDYLVQQVAFVDHIGEIPAIEVRYRIQHVFGKAEREQLGNLYYERPAPRSNSKPSMATSTRIPSAKRRPSTVTIPTPARTQPETRPPPCS